MMKFLTASLLVISLAFSGVTAYADDDYDNDDRTEQQVRTDKQFAKKKQQAIALLKKKGYKVVKVEADTYRGQKALDVEAYKKGMEYNIKLAYPSLRILREKRDD